MKVGFVGAGRMGRPMVARLAASGHDVRVLIRGTSDPTKLEALGATAVTEVTDAAAQADVVVLCVFTDEQVRQVCLDDALLCTMPPGSTLVVHTTTSPTTIEAIAAQTDRVEVVDAPVSGGPHVQAAHVVQLERRGVPESTVLGALAHGSATSRVLDIVAASGSVAGFIEVAGEFVGKDVAVVRSIADEVGSNLGALDTVIDAVDVGGKV